MKESTRRRSAEASWWSPFGAAAIAAIAAGALAVACDEGGGAEVLECEGNCSCDPDTRTCSCSGGTECVVAGFDDITLECEGNARCDMACGELCHVECGGTTGCDAEMGDASTARCHGNGECDYTCLGDCEIDCSGTAACVVTCAEGADCSITSCDGELEDCGDGLQACRRSCPVEV